jgi:c-di-GMP-binding flagellar brake protein YcgR
MNSTIFQSGDDLPQRVRVRDQVFIVPASDEEKLGFQSRVRGVSISGLLIDPPISPRGDRLPTEGEKVKVNLLGEEHEIAFTSVLREVPAEGETLYSLALPRKYTLSGRRFVRFEVDTDVTFHKLSFPSGADGSPSLGRLGKGRLLNLSLGGVLLETSRHFQEGDLLLLNLNLNFGGTLHDLLGRVQRVEKLPEGSSLVGIQFCKESELQPQLAEQISRLVPEGMSDLDRGIRSLTARLLQSEQRRAPKVEAV